MLNYNRKIYPIYNYSSVNTVLNHRGCEQKTMPDGTIIVHAEAKHSTPFYLICVFIK